MRGESSLNKASFANSKAKEQGNTKLKQYLNQFREGLKNALQLFELSNYESEKKKLNLAKSREEYFNQL